MDYCPDRVPLDLPRVTYKTPLLSVVLKIIFSIEMFILGVILVPGLFAACGYMMGIFFGLPPLIACVPAALFGMFVVRQGWWLTTAHLRFRISFGADTVEIGRGWLRRSFAYDEIETISLPEHNKRFGVVLEAGHKNAIIELEQRDEAICLAILRAKCSNAIVVDRSGREYLPPDPDRPLQSLAVLYKRHRWIAAGIFVGTPLLALCCVCHALLILDVLLGRMNVPPIEFALHTGPFAGELIALWWLIRFGPRRIKMALILKDKLAELQRTRVEE
jgi:hypothetical protein